MCTDAAAQAHTATHCTHSELYVGAYELRIAMPRTKSYSLHSQYIGCMHVHWTYAYNCHRVYACALDYTGSCRSSESRGPRHSLILARAPTRREASFASFSRPLNVMTRHEVVVTLLPRPGGARASGPATWVHDDYCIFGHTLRTPEAVQSVSALVQNVGQNLKRA